MNSKIKILVATGLIATYSVTAQIKVKVPKLGGGKDNSSNSSNTNSSSATNETTYKVNDKVSIEEKGKWYPGYIMEVKADQYKIHYDGYDPKYDTWVTTARLKPLGGTVAAANTATAAPAAGTYTQGQIVEVFDGTNWTEGEVFQVGGSGRYQVLQGTLYTWYYPKDMRPTNKDNANVERDKIAEQKKKDDEAKAKQDSEDQVGVIEGEKYKQFMADADFAVDAVGQLCYFLDNPPSQAPGFAPSNLSKTLEALAKLDKIIKEKYPNAKSAKYVNRFSSPYSQQPGLFREVAEQRVSLAKKALAASIQQQLRDSKYSFDTEFGRMKTDYTNSKTIYCAGFMEWAYMPASYKKYKNDIRVQYEKAYKDAGLEFKDDEVFVTLNKQLEQVKQYTEQNISSYPLDAFKAKASIHEKEAEAAAMAAFKLDHPEATPVYYGCYSDYVISYDNNWAPPKNLGKGLSVGILAKVAGIPYLVAYSCNIDKAYKGGGNYGPAQLNNNGFWFWGMVNIK